MFQLLHSLCHYINSFSVQQIEGRHISDISAIIGRNCKTNGYRFAGVAGMIMALVIFKKIEKRWAEEDTVGVNAD